MKKSSTGKCYFYNIYVLIYILIYVLIYVLNLRCYY